MFAVTLLLLCLLFIGVFSLPGTFWHITDLHWDPTYDPNNTPEKVCASSGKRPAANAGTFGDYACDSPLKLIYSSVFAMKDILPDPDFIVWTGDDTPHVPNEVLGEVEVLHIIRNLTSIIKAVFPKTKVYSALGNHDFHPKHQHPAEPNYIYNQTAQMWQDWLDPDSQKTFRKGGYYTEKLLNRNGFRMLVLNTNLYYNQNKVTNDLEDPADQFRWADQVLTDAASNNEKVYIIGHIPPGVFEKKRNKTWYLPKFNQKYLELIQKHHPVVQGQFFGHHHTDSFRMFYKSEERDCPVSTMFISPGVSPWKTTLPGVVNGANNPGIRVFEYNRESLLVQDVVTYYLNLTRANVGQGRWEKEYRLTETFRVPDASPASMNQVLQRVATERCFLQKFYEFNSVNYDLTECNGDCRLDHICAAREVDYDLYATCVTGGSASVQWGLLHVMSVSVSLLLATKIIIQALFEAS